MRRQHHENEESSEEEIEDHRATEIIVEKAGKKTKRNFPFQLDWQQPAQRKKTKLSMSMSQNHGNNRKRAEKERILFEQNDMVREDINKRINIGNKLNLSYSVSKPNATKKVTSRL